jgi:hypothetical protein
MKVPLFFLLFIISACKKSDNTPFYRGTITGTTNCVISNDGGAPVVIYISPTDSICTTTLPNSLKTTGSIIQFQITETGNQDPTVICTGETLRPRLVKVYNVSKID